MTKLLLSIYSLDDSIAKMFKLCIALCVVATFATEAPVISLDLSHTNGLVKYANVQASHPKLDYHTQQAKLVAGGNTKATSFVHKCPAGLKSSVTDCSLPTARAYDHHQGSVGTLCSFHDIQESSLNSTAFVTAVSVA